MNLDIRSKLIAASAIVITLAITLTSAFSIYQSRDILLSNSMEKELPAVMGKIANSINTDLQLPITVARVMANNPDYKQFIVDGERDSSELVHYLGEIKQEFDATSSFLVSEQTGNYYTADGILTQVTPNDSQYSWFYDFKNSGKPFVVVMSIDQANGKMTLFVNYRVEINGQFKALAGVGFAVDHVSQLVEQYKIGETGKVFLTDATGTITVHTDKSKVGQDYFEQINLSNSRLLNEQNFQVTEHEHDYRHLIATSYLPDLGWYIVADVPEKEILQQLGKVTTSLVLLGVIIAVVFLLFIAVIIKALVSPFSNMTKLLEDIGQGGGDLTIRLDDTRKDEVGRMARGYNAFVEHLANILLQVSEVANELHESVDVVKNKTAYMNSELGIQRENTEQVATAVEQMGGTAKEIAHSAQSAAEFSENAQSLASQGTASVEDTLATVNQTTTQLAETTELVKKLAENTESIDSILDVIRSVSEQTNLLALNAAIEAARAGEHGRGFAVVADEVRTLASRSQQSTEEIRATIESLKDQTHVVVDSIAQSVEMSNNSLTQASQSGEHLSEIVANMSKVNDMNFQIASATEEQSNVVGEITPHVAAIANVSNHNAESLDEMSADSQRLNDMSDSLNKLVGNFKLR